MRSSFDDVTGVERVESGAPDPAVAQALDQRLFVDDRTARGVHEPRIRFHERQFVRPAVAVRRKAGARELSRFFQAPSPEF